jgi:hypothetical protein
VGVVVGGDVVDDGSGVFIASSPYLRWLRLRTRAGRGVAVNSVEPGFVATKFGRNSGSVMQGAMFGIVRFMQIPPEVSVEAVVYVAISPEVESMSFKCYAWKQVEVHRL